MSPLYPGEVSRSHPNEPQPGSAEPVGQSAAAPSCPCREDLPAPVSPAAPVSAAAPVNLAVVQQPSSSAAGPQTTWTNQLLGVHRATGLALPPIQCHPTMTISLFSL